MFGQIEVVIHVCTSDGCKSYVADSQLRSNGLLCLHCAQPMEAVATVLNVPLPAEPVPA